MKRYLLILLLTICSALYSHKFYYQKEVFQGHPITFIITPVEGSYSYNFSLYSLEGKKVFKLKGFNYYMQEIKTPMILGLGGIPSNLDPGRYKVKVEGKGLYDSYYFERVVVVKDKKYPKTTIKANAKMDAIINGEIGPERIRQSNIWWAAVNTFSPYALYHEGKLKEPVKNARHSSPFGFRRTFKYPKGKEKLTIHRGEDYAIKKGTPVYSNSPGKVLLSENRIVTGNTVILEHLPGVVSMYYHMDRLDVKKDDIIKGGHKIGEVGTTGFSTGPHLHWEVRFSTIPVDAKYLIKRPLIDKSLIMNIINSTNNKKGG